MKKLAFIVDYYPYLGGYSNRITEQLRFLSKHFDIHLIYLFRKSENENIDVSKYAKEHRIESEIKERKNSSEISKNPLTLLGNPQFIINILKNTIFYGSPMYYSPYVSDQTRSKVKRIIEEQKIEVVWANGIIGALMIGRLRAKMRILDLCDSRYVLYSTLRSIEPSFLKRIVFWLEMNLARNFEKNAADKFDLLTYICKRDGQSAGLDAKKFFVLPNIRESTVIRKREIKTDIVMLGRWDYLPNLDALTFAVREVFPKVTREINVEVIGMIKDSDRDSLMWACRGATNTRLKIAGVVGNLFEHLTGARLMLAPIRAGAGIQNKIIDAMEIGIPVVTTPFSKNGIDPENKCSGIITCNKPDEFARTIDRLLAQPRECGQLGDAARAYFETQIAESIRRHGEIVKKINEKIGS